MRSLGYAETLLLGATVYAPPPTGNTASDTANLQAALNAVPSTGGIVRMRNGNYALNPPLTASNPTTLIGAGKGDLTTAAPTVLSVNSATADGIVVNAHGCSLLDFAVVNTSGATPTAGAGIHVTAGDALAITRVKMVGFWNNLQIDQARHYTITDSHFMDQVSYGAYLRNTASGQGDFGDCIFQGCFFASYNTTRIAAAGIRWESGGGLKVLGCKTNGNMSTLGQSFTIGVDIKVADGISTSVFVIDGNSFEGINSGGAPISVGQTGTGTGTITKIIVTNNETLAGGGIRFSAIQAAKVGQILVSGNTVTGATCGIYFQNVYSFTVGPNRMQALPSTDPAIWVATGCTDYTITAPDVDTTNVALIMDDSAQSNTHSRVGTTTTYTREITSTTSNVTYTTLFSVQFNAYCSAVITLNMTGQVAGVGSFVYSAVRAATQAAAATTPTIATVNTDTSTANAPTVLFDVTTNQTVLVKVKLGASGTDVYGKATLTVDGLPSRVWKS